MTTTHVVLVSGALLLAGLLVGFMEALAWR